MATRVSPTTQPGETGLRSLGRRDWATWPKYEAAVLGFRDYWYPVTWSRKVTRRPLAVTVLGERLMLIREAGVVRALHDRCPHRGVPLSHPMSSQEFAGTWSWRKLCDLTARGEPQLPRPDRLAGLRRNPGGTPD